MITIYCIEDCNSLKYVGSTKLKLNRRLSKHKTDKKRNHYCSSSKLDLDNCEIYSLETDVIKSQKKERERYWINKIDCVNEIKLNFDIKEHMKEYYQKNKEHQKEYYQKNKEKKKELDKEYKLFRSKRVVNGCYEFIKMLEQY
jgi:hypothetical protein